MVVSLKVLEDSQDRIRHAVDVRQKGLRDDAHAHG
jgi:hypothetical protein